jgi:hypothetical protein
MDGVIILGAEIVWSGRVPQTARTTIDWETLKRLKKPVTIALRVASFPGPFKEDDIPARHIAETAKLLLAAASVHGVELNEFHLDFDCAEKKLGGYRARAWFTAAWIARYDGMELMGTEGSPDGFSFGGDFELPDLAKQRQSGVYQITRYEDG